LQITPGCHAKLSPQVTSTSNNRRLLEVTAKYEVLINTTDAADAAALSIATEVLQNVTQAAEVDDPSDIAWCGEFCEKHAESIDLQQTGEQKLVMDQMTLRHACYSLGHDTCAAWSKEEAVQQVHTALLWSSHGLDRNLTTNHALGLASHAVLCRFC
jgi:hypothetical protein